MDRNRRRTLYLMGLATVGTAVPVGFFVLRGSEDLLSASQTFARYLKTSHPNLYRHLSSRSAAPAQARSAMQEIDGLLIDEVQMLDALVVSNEDQG